MRTLITALTFLALTLTACGGQEKDSGSSSSTASTMPMSRSRPT